MLKCFHGQGKKLDVGVLGSHVSDNDLPWQLRPGPEPEPGILLPCLSMKRAKDGSSEHALMSSKVGVHQVQQGTCIPLNKKKKNANIQKGGYSIVSSFYNHAGNRTLCLLWYQTCFHLSERPLPALA